MENNRSTTGEKDPGLWALAKKRAGFKRGLAFYIVINAFLWLIWLLTNDRPVDDGIPWPIWPTAGWGLGILIEYVSIFKYPKENAVEKEYEKLKQRFNK